MRSKGLWFFPALLLSGCLLQLPAEGEEFSSDPLPFTPGERLVYRLSWGIFKVGQAELEVTGVEEFRGEPVYVLKARIRTNGFADALFRVRDEYVSYVTQDFSRTVYFTKSEKHKARSREVEVAFDWERREAQYALHGNKRAPISLRGNAFDPVSAIFAARLRSLMVGGELKMAVTDGKTYGDVPVKVIEEEKISTKAGEYDTVLVEPELDEVSEVFRKKKKAFVKFWLSNDERKLPVRIISKVKWGSFRAELERVEAGEMETYAVNSPS